ncbi:oxygenase MpaB family protein [Chryseosolibacter histidini]|uniref:oxygenase MpaB family protein n=1 Tax=Chryseosolibacter histidini TaxID=2782349 RepID=UPI003F694615
MDMEYFVDKHSVVRQIWGKSDTILFIFAGAAAEFALNKAVDWLYFTGRLPVDPLGRLFSTVSYAQAIVFSEKQAALRAIDSMAKIHAGVEAKRSVNIPDWAYRDVLFMLIDYSIRSFEVLDRQMSIAEKNEVFLVFTRMGIRMGLKGLPETFEAWEKMRQEHLQQNMQHSNYTDDLFMQYRKHLGAIRYRILIETQILVVPSKVREMLGFRRISLMNPIIAIYKVSRSLKLDWVLKELILPKKYKKEIRGLDSVNEKDEGLRK